MLSDDYLVKGLTAMSRTMDRGENWASAHMGAGAIAAYYFCQDNRLDDRTVVAIKGQLDQMIAKHVPLFEPLAAQRPEARLLDEIPKHLEENISMLPIQGHNVIFTALAIKALREVPEMTTPGVIGGICRVLDRLTDKGTDPALRFGDEVIEVSDVGIESDGTFPEYTDYNVIAEFTFDEFLKFSRIYNGMHGQMGHLVTHAQALIELSRLGYDGLARKGHDAHRLHAKRLRRLHDYENNARTFARPAKDSPLTHAYWQSDSDRLALSNWAFGHTFKYCYHFYDLLRYVGDTDKRRKVIERMAYIL